MSVANTKINSGRYLILGEKIKTKTHKNGSHKRHIKELNTVRQRKNISQLSSEIKDSLLVILFLIKQQHQLTPA